MSNQETAPISVKTQTGFSQKNKLGPKPLTEADPKSRSDLRFLVSFAAYNDGGNDDAVGCIDLITQSVGSSDLVVLERCRPWGDAGGLLWRKSRRVSVREYSMVFAAFW